MSVIVFSLLILFVLLMLPAIGPAVTFIKGAFATLVCMDVINRPYDSTTFNVLLDHCSGEKYYISRKFIFHNIKKILSLFMQGRIASNGFGHLEERFYYKDGSSAAALPFHIAMRNILIYSPEELKNVEDIVIEKGKKNARILYEFAIATKDLDFSRKRLFVAVCKIDLRYRNDFVELFKEDPEIEKLASLS